MAALIPNGGNDRIFTPDFLSKSIIKHFNPKGKILDPCMGGGAFFNNFPNSEELRWCEIDKGVDFFNFSEKVDWVISNFPWSKYRAFLKHSMEIGENIVSLQMINALFMRARLRDIKEMNFGIKEILFIDHPPKPFVQTGIQLGVIHLQSKYNGHCNINYLNNAR